MIYSFSDLCFFVVVVVVVVLFFLVSLLVCICSLASAACAVALGGVYFVPLSPALHWNKTRNNALYAGV